MTDTRPTQLLSIPAAAERLDCSPGHIYHLIAAGALTTVNISAAKRSKTRIRAAELEQFIENRSQS